DNCTSFERDNYAVMKMSCELLGMSWGLESDIYPTIANAIRAELEDPVFGFKDLGRFKKAIDSNDLVPEQDLIEITAGNADEIISILPDNGHLYVKVKSNPKAPAEVNVTFSGIGGSFTAVFNKDQKTLVHGFRPRARVTIRKQDIDESQFEIDTGIKIIPGSPQDLSALTVLLNEEESFARAIELIAATEDVQVQEPLTLQLKDTFA
ncbi:AAA domain-containing protein, partial [Escherichia coli]